jgi:hypothetical protein
MIRTVGFNRKIRLSYLDFAWQQILATGDASTAMLDTMMAADIHGANRRAKAVDEVRELFTTPSTRQLVKCAAELCREKQLDPDDRLAVYWSLFLPAFPFARQAWAVMGRFGKLGPQFSSRAYSQRLSEVYGGGRAVAISIEEVLGMTRDWGVVIMDKPGFYHLAPQRSISKATQRLLLTALCLTSDPPVYALSHFPDELALFPFKLRLSVTDLRHKNSGLTVSVQGGQDVMVEPTSWPVKE